MMKDSISIPSDSRPSEAALFEQAVSRPREERPRLLNAVSGQDPDMRRRLEVLLEAHENPETGLSAGLTHEKTVDSVDLDVAVGQTIGRYKILEKLGEGGCGVVYVAEQTTPVRRRVALKLIKLGMDTKSVVARFDAERQALAMMDHPNIAKVLDAGATESELTPNNSTATSIPKGRPYFVMELVRGISITEYCDQNNLSPKERLHLFAKVCHAIQHAHQKGVIHRDIKPSNILVTLHDGVPVPKVIDFGIAKATEGRLTDATVYTQLHQFIGTPAYMSPEQAEMSGLDIDTRSDIYSLGVLLYELLTGRTPFDGKELVSMGLDAMRRTIRDREPSRPSVKMATISNEDRTATAQRRSTDNSKLTQLLKGDLDWIVMKCLEKDRTRRYDAANDLAKDIQRHLGNEPVVARPPSALYKARKALKRNPLAYGSGFGIAASLVIGIVGSTAGWAQAQTERDHAIDAWTVAEEAKKQAILAKEEAEAARQLAENRFKSAREFVNTLVHEVGPEFYDLHGANQAREMLAKASVEFLDDLAPKKNENAEFQLELARLYYVVSNSDSHVYGPTDINAFLHRAFDIARSLYESNPEDPEIAKVYAMCLAERRLVDPSRDEWIENLKERERILADLSQRNPEDTETENDLILARVQLGDGLFNRGRHEEAMNGYLIPLVAEFKDFEPAGDDAPQSLFVRAEANRRLATSLFLLDRAEESIPYWDNAVNLFRNLHKQNPNSGRFNRYLARNLTFSASAFRAIGDYKTASERLQEGVRLGDEAARRSPDHWKSAEIWIYTRYWRAVHYSDAGKNSEFPIAQRITSWEQTLKALDACRATPNDLPIFAQRVKKYEERLSTIEEEAREALKELRSAE